jgi:hypothetical protein
MALNANALLDFATLQGYTSRAAGEQAKFEGLINVASERAEKYTGRKLAQASYTIVRDNFRAPLSSIFLPEFPVSALTHLYIDSLSVFGAGTEIAAYAGSGPGYLLDGATGQVDLYGVVAPSGPNVWKAVFTSGYALPVPSDLQWAIAEFVTWLAARIDSRVIGQRYSTLDGMNVSFEIDIPAHVKSILDDYRRLY